MTIEDFLEETADSWDKQSFKEADADLKKLSSDAWIKKWGPKIMSNKNMAADFYNLKNFKPLPERIRNSFKEFNFAPSDAWKQQIYQSEYKDVPRAEFERVLSNMKKYYDEEIARQDSIAARKEREEEVKDWGWRDIVASDYAKQRYIEEPNTSIFGKQAPEFGKAPETRWAAGADLGVGAVGATTDFIPPAWLVGPIVRTGRDLGYKLTDSKYSKDWKDIAYRGVTDYGINKVARYLPNARREQRIVNQMTDKKVASVLAAEQSMKNTKQAVKEMNPMNVWVNYDTDMELVQRINALPESHMKNELMQVINGAYAGKPIDRAAIGDIASKYQYLTSEGGLDNARKFVRGDWSAKPFYGQNEFVKEQAYAPTLGELTNKQKASYVYNKLVNHRNVGELGQISVQGLANLTGRGHGNVNYDNSEEFNRQKEYYKQTRGEDWLRFGATMAPSKDNEPAWEAYKEIMGIR